MRCAVVVLLIKPWHTAAGALTVSWRQKARSQWLAMTAYSCIYFQFPLPSLLSCIHYNYCYWYYFIILLVVCSWLRFKSALTPFPDICLVFLHNAVLLAPVKAILCDYFFLSSLDTWEDDSQSTMTFILRRFLSCLADILIPHGTDLHKDFFVARNLLFQWFNAMCKISNNPTHIHFHCSAITACRCLVWARLVWNPAVGDCLLLCCYLDHTMFLCSD